MTCKNKVFDSISQKMCYEKKKTPLTNFGGLTNYYVFKTLTNLENRSKNNYINIILTF